MARTSLAARFLLASAAFAAAASLTAPAARATAPSITPKVLQCDGSFLAGTVTSHPTPTVRAEALSSNPGLKIGQRRLSVLPSSTLALWRFDGDYGVTVSSNYTSGCPSACCKTWYYNYVSTNGSPNLDTGRCSYRDAINGDCSDLTVMSSFGTSQPPVQIGACPANPSTLAVASSSFAITAIGARPGATTLGLSSTSLQLNGSTQFASSPNSTSWNLPGNYTLAAWINATGATGRIVSQQSGTGYWGMGVSAGGLRHFDSRDTSAPDVTRGSGLTGGWHMVHVVRRNGIDRSFYIDGVFISSVVALSSSSFSSHPINSTLEIGRYSGGSEFFNGKIDDVRIINTTMSDDDIMLEWTTQMHYYSSNSGLTFSTAAGSFSGSPSNGTTGVVTYVPPEAYSASARWGFTAATIDGEAAFGGSFGVTIDSSKPIAPTLTGTPTSINDVTWSWGLPPRVCLPPGSASVFYNLVDAPTDSDLTPPGSIAYPTATVGENLPGSPNRLVGRKLRVTDTWGWGLGAGTSVYTLANPPLAASVVPSVVSTASALISWGQNGNPSYTRYLLSYSQSSSFATGLSTPVALADGFTGSSFAIAGLAPGTTYYARVQAYSGRASDAFGNIATVFVSTSFTTLPDAPSLGGAPAGFTSIKWDWTAVPGARYYNLYDGSGALLHTGPELTFTQTGLTTNTEYTSRVEGVSGSGAGARGTGTAFTLARDPTAGSVVAVNASSITYAWNGGLNPAYTFYEVVVTTDATFGIIVTTVTVNATTVTVTGLFPGTSYYAQLRSVNGGQVLGGVVPLPQAFTRPDPAITLVLSPPSAYVPANGSVGQWQFDESTGTTAADTSIYGNRAYLACLTASCVSTPTFVAGPAGLGSAVSFSGLADSLARVPDAAQYAFTGSLTISAWVNPSSAIQPNGAGIVVRGAGGVENFALEVSGQLWRFVPKPGFVAASTNTISASRWTHLIAVYDSVAGSGTLYVDGRPASTVAGVGAARLAAAHDISIGSRQSAAGSYDRGFLGSIDSVRVQSRALTASEALAEYQGSFISTVTPPSPNDTVLIGLAPNAFGAPATIVVSVDPYLHPVLITSAFLNAGMTVVPTGYTLVPNSLLEIVPIVSGAPFGQTLGSSASVSIPYSDANGDGIIDGSSPPLAAAAIKVYTLNTTVNRWESLPTFVDTGSKRVTFFTPHFSVFAMFAPLTIGTSLSQVRVYPIPWRPASLSRFDAAGVTFDRLPVSGSIRLLNLAGERVRDISFDGSAAGTVVWNGMTDAGRRAASGVYFARISSANGGTTILKLAVER